MHRILPELDYPIFMGAGLPKSFCFLAFGKRLAALSPD
jgi:hypothetical protein